MKVPAPSLAPILRSDAQGRILARVFADPDRRFSLSDLAALASASLPTVSREIGRAEQAGLVTTDKVGPTRQVRAAAGHPLYGEISRVVLAAYGPPIVVAEEFADVEGAESVLLFGSWAARYLGQAGRAPCDIDVLVIGDVDRDQADAAAERAEARLRIPVQATVRKRAQWDSQSESFVGEVKSRPLLQVLGSTGPDMQEPAAATS